MNFLLAAISLGFLGSFHCVGMCGPIALALPINDASAIKRITGGVLYNFGRVTTYALFGAFFGLIGQSFVLAGYQQILSIILGAAILIMVLLPNQLAARFRLTGVIYSSIGRLKNSLGTLLKKRSLHSLYFIGTLNGLLPCGLVYLGIAGAIATGNSLQGALFMALFGLGTLPAMLTITLVRNSISLTFREKINKFMPVFVGAMAILLILRGLNLGIPYISPQLNNTTNATLTCCHK